MITPPINDVMKVLMVATREEKVLLNCYIQTGARRSEIFRWKWLEDINFDRKQYRLGTKKTKDGSMSYRWFPMSEELYSDLWWWYNNRPVKTSMWVFCVSLETHLHYGEPHKDYRGFLRRLCDRAQVPRFGYHGLRAFFASVLADKHKQSSKTIQILLRHANVSTTERYLNKLHTDLSGVVNLISETIHEGHTDGTHKIKKG